MAEESEKKIVELKPGEIVVDQKTLLTIQEQMASIEKSREDDRAKMAGLEELARAAAENDGAPKLKDRKSFTPAFRTVGIKKMAMGGDPEKEGYVVGWTNRGAYQKVDKSGVSAQIVDYIDVIFLDHERNADDTKLQAESIPLLSLMNAQEITCKVLEVKDFEGKPYKIRYQPIIDPDLASDQRDGEQKKYTGEMINVTTWDPKHGLVETGEQIEGWVAFTNLIFVVQIPGRAEPVEIDAKFCNI